MSFGEELINSILGVLNNKIVEYESLDDYLESKKIEQLRIILSKFLYCSKADLVENLDEVTNFSKEQVIKMTKNNLYDIVFDSLLGLSKGDIDFLETMTTKGNSLILEDETDFPFPLFLKNINTNILFEAYYDKETSKLYIYIQKSIYEEMKKILKSKLFINKFNKVVSLRADLEKIMDVYGIIEEKVIYKLYNKEFAKITLNEFRNLLNYITFGSGTILYNFVGKTKYIITLSNENSLEDYLKNIDDSIEYKLYDKSFYEDVHDLKYLKSLNSYQTLYKYLKSFYGLDLEEEGEVLEIIVVDYIYQMQENIDKKIAQKNVLSNMNYFFDNSSKEKREILSYLNKIYYDYPKWQKRGNI